MTAAELHPVLAGGAYRAYVYAYPHKTAYRPLAPVALRDVWADEPQRHLFLYVHVPFCTMRCGFCNLFTTPNPRRDLVTFYLDALRRQDVILAVGRADRLVGQNRDLSGKLWAKGIGNALREWDGVAHDWPTWQRMLTLYVDGHD